jgi:hypothetical protein
MIVRMIVVMRMRMRFIMMVLMLMTVVCVTMIVVVAIAVDRGIRVGVVVLAGQNRQARLSIVGASAS